MSAIFGEFFILAVVLLAAVVQSRLIETELDSCLSTDNNPYRQHSTKTFYASVRGNADRVSKCKPIQFWGLFRHGTRHPKKDDIKIMKKAKEIHTAIFQNMAEGRDVLLCNRDVGLLAAWKWNKTIEDTPYYLTEQGFVETTELARRFKERYPSLLGGSYSKKDFYFRHTLTQRTEATCKAFIEGLFDNEIKKVEIDTPRENDDELRPYDACPLWLKDGGKNKNFTRAQQNIFQQQEDFYKLRMDISKRLGFNDTLTLEEISIMFDNCRYERSWYPERISPWCSVFTAEELIILEYNDDLELFYKHSYGYPNNARLGCRPLTNMMSLFKETVETKKVRTKAVHLFSHDTLLGMVLTTLGHGNDRQMLPGADYGPLLKDRLFKSSLDLPFGSNIVAVLHECDDGPYGIEFFLNERPLEFEGCKNSSVCTWEELVNLLPNIEQCTLDFCKID